VRWQGTSSTEKISGWYEATRASVDDSISSSSYDWELVGGGGGTVVGWGCVSDGARAGWGDGAVLAKGRRPPQSVAVPAAATALACFALPPSTNNRLTTKQSTSQQSSLLKDSRFFRASAGERLVALNRRLVRGRGAAAAAVFLARVTIKLRLWRVISAVDRRGSERQAARSVLIGASSALGAHSFTNTPCRPRAASTNA